MIDRYRTVFELAVDSAARTSGEDFAATLRASFARYHVPDGDAAVRLRLYEAALSREMYRAMHELERLQRRRMGEYVAPPAKIEMLV